MLRAFSKTKDYAQNARVRVFLMSVTLLVVPLFLYFSMHVTSSIRYFNDRNFRQLRGFSGQVSGRINSLGTAFKNAVERYVDQPSKDRHGDFQAYLEVLKTDGADFSKGTLNPADATVAKDVKVNIDITNEDSDTWLNFEGSNGTITASARTNLPRVIDPLLSKGDDGQPQSDDKRDFDHIIIARADDGKTLFEQTTGNLNVTSLEHIVLADTPDKTFDLKNRSQTTDGVDVSIAGARYKLYVQPIEIALPTKGENAETLWVICGLVDASRFRYQTWAISYTVLIISGFVAGLLILSWFFLKLLFIGPKDRLRPAETRVLAVTIVVAGSLLTLFLLFGVSYKNVEKTLDAQLEKLAETFQEHFQAEVKSAVAQLKTLDENRLNFKTEADHTPDNASALNRPNLLSDICPSGNCDKKQNPYPYFKSVFWVNDKGDQVAKWSIYSQTTRLINVSGRGYYEKPRNGYFRELDGGRFWVDPVVSRNTGAFTVALSTRTKAPGAQGAGVAVLDTNLMSFMQPVIVGGFSYRIIDTNGNVVFPNLKENFIVECDNDPRLRSAVSGHLKDYVSVMYLGRDARVYVRPLTGMPEWTIVVFRDKEPLRSSYLEVVAVSSLLFAIYLTVLLLTLAFLFYVVPFKHVGRKWMWPSRDNAGIYIQSIPISVLLSFAAYGLSFRLSDRTLIVALSLLSVLALLLMMAQLKNRWVLSPFEKLAGFLEGLPKKLKLNHFKLNERFFFTLSLVPLVFVIAVLPSAAFFRLAYNEQMDLFTKYGQVTLVNSLNDREARLRAAYPISLFGNNTAAADTFLTGRLKESLDTYDGFFFSTSVKPVEETPNEEVAPEPQHGLLVSLSQMLPFASQSSVIRHGLIRSRSDDGLWQWRQAENSQLILRAPQNSPRHKVEKPGTTGAIGALIAESKDDEKKTVFQVVSITPHFWLRRLSWLYFVAIMVLVLFLILRMVIKRVFLMDAVKMSDLAMQPAVPSGKWKRFLVLRSPYTRRRELRPASDFKVLDLKTEAVGHRWADEFKLEEFLKEVSTQSIAIDSFEHRMDDPKQNLQKLTLLEKFLSYQGTLLVTSTADPMDYVFEKAKKDANQQRINDAAARWAGIMSKFWINYLEDTGDSAEAFRKKLDEIRKGTVQLGEAEKNGQPQPGSQQAGAPQPNGGPPAVAASHSAQEEQFRCLLTTECAPRASLQEIAIEIAQRRDEKVSADEIVEEVLIQASTYYKLLWESCTPTEKLTLTHLAIDGFVSPNDPDLAQLVRRGLIVRDPEVRLMNRSFRYFVLGVCRMDDDVAETEGQARKSSSWQYMKVALIVAVAVLMLFLFSTQRDLYNSTLVAVTSIAAGLPAIFNIFNLFQKNVDPRPPSS